jgi:hypothetical protein
MIPIGSLYKRCIYTCEFEDGSIYVGLTFSVRERSLTRLIDKRDVVFQYKESTGLSYKVKQITDFLPINEAVIKEEEFRQQFIDEGKNVLNRVKCGSIGTPHRLQKKKEIFFDGIIKKRPFNRKSVKIIDTHTGSNQIVKSAREASRITEVSPVMICNMCKGKCKTRKRYLFEYK